MPTLVSEGFFTEAPRVASNNGYLATGLALRDSCKCCEMSHFVTDEPLVMREVSTSPRSAGDFFSLATDVAVMPQDSRESLRWRVGRSALLRSGAMLLYEYGNFVKCRRQIFM